MRLCEIGDVVQFNEKHKWRGCLGIVCDVKLLGEGDVRILIGVPVLKQGIAFIVSLLSQNDFEIIGKSAFTLFGVLDEEENDQEN